MTGDLKYKTGLAGIIDFDPGSWEKKIPRNCMVDRNKTLLKLCSGQRVLHLGAADYPFHKEGAVNDALLHQRLNKVAEKVIGIEQNKDAIEYLKSNHGIDNIIYADTTANLPINDDRLNDNFDVILCCDIIEHVENPGLLIEFCKKYMMEKTLLVITTINASSIKLALRALQGREAVHHDHVAYYSYSTLCQLLFRYQLVPVQTGFFSYGTKLKITGWIFNFMANIAPASADGIVITCKKRGHSTFSV